MQPRRLARLNKLIRARVAEVLIRNMKDPRLGMVTITKVELDRELMSCKVYWSVLGDEKQRRINEEALQHARKFIQHEVAEVLATRNVPQLKFVFDESIAGSIRVGELLREIGEESEQQAEEGAGEESAEDEDGEA